MQGFLHDDSNIIISNVQPHTKRKEQKKRTLVKNEVQ